MAIFTYLTDLLKSKHQLKGTDDMQSLSEHHITSDILKLLKSSLDSNGKDVLDLLLDKNRSSSCSSSNRTCKRCSQKNVIVVIQTEKRPRVQRVAKRTIPSECELVTHGKSSLQRAKRQSLVYKVNNCKQLRLSTGKVTSFAPVFSSTFLETKAKLVRSQLLHSTLRTKNNFKSFPDQHRNSQQPIGVKPSPMKVRADKLKAAKPPKFVVDYASTPIKSSPKTSTPNSTPVKSLELFY